MECAFCPATENLMVQSTRTLKDGTEVKRYICRKCRAKRGREYYHKPGNKERTMIANMRSLAKRFGFKLVKDGKET